MATLAEIRKKLQEAERKSSSSGTFSGDNAVYPFWNMENGKESTIRFLPDGNQSNEFFWVERTMIKLPFAGIKGETDNRIVQVHVPCMHMYKETCPILSEVQGWFKDPSLEEMGRKYWKKRSYIFQGFVTDDGLKEENKPENPIRRFVISPQIYQLVAAGLVDPELEKIPTDFVHGIDFKITKSSKGGYADYSTSKWGRRERPLSDAELSAIEQHGLFNLSDFLPKKPTEVEQKIIKDMFKASVDGEPFDKDAWGQYYRPAGMGSSTGDPAQRQATNDAIEYSEPVAAVAPAPAAPSGSSKAEDILAMIRNRKQ